MNMDMDDEDAMNTNNRYSHRQFEQDQVQAELLEEYWGALKRDAALPPPPPAGLDLQLASLARRLQYHLGAPEPDAGFALQLGHRLQAEIARRDGPTTALPGKARAVGRVRWAPALILLFGDHRRLRLPAAVAIGLAVLALLLAGAGLWAGRPAQVSARELVEKAGRAVQNVTASNIHSFEMTEVQTEASGARVETHLWFSEPDKWRIEAIRTSPSSTSSPATMRGQQGYLPHRWVVVADGHTIWRYDPDSRVVEVAAGSLGPSALSMASGPDGSGTATESLHRILQGAAACYSPVLAGEERVAGRQAYVVRLGASKCASASMPESNGPATVWLDKDTFFVLKSTIQDPESGQVVLSTEVTGIRYNLTLAGDLFTFTPPTGTVVRSEGGSPGPGPETSPTATSASPTTAPLSLAEVRGRVTFPVFVPTYVPAGLVPQPPVWTGGAGDTVEINYVRAGGPVVLQVLNGPAGCCLDADPRKAGRILTLPDGTPAHLFGYILWWHQDGTYLALTAPDLPADELVKIAASMSDTADTALPQPPAETGTPAQGTATPPPPGFRVLRPDRLPEPLAVREEHLQDPTGSVYVILHFDLRPTNGIALPDALTLLERPQQRQGGPDVADPQAVLEVIAGRKVAVTRRGEACTAFDWVQDGVLLSLTNSYDPSGQVRYSCEQMRTVVESVR